MTSVAELPQFDVAVQDFTRVLSEHGHPTAVVWVFRDDIWRRSSRHVLVRWPVRPGAPVLAERVYEQGRRRGIAAIDAIAHGRTMTFATVWFPKFAEDEVQGWSEDLKLSIADPLVRAELIPSLMWLAIRCMPAYWRYQRSFQWVGTRKWARAAQQ
jgi:hypothetical protein